MLNFRNKILKKGILLLLVCLWQLCCYAQAQTIPDVLKTSWQFYKQQFMEDDERVRSEYYHGTISEGQSYALLKAVWMHDKPVFDKTWQWTKTHLARPHDHLFAWSWGKPPNGPPGVLDYNQATDADEDIAHALLLASETWKQPAYQQAAVAIIQDMWKYDVIHLKNHYYLLPGTWEEFKRGYLTLDPSYFAPYVYRKFAQYDKAHAKGWLQLADDSYPTLEACSNLTANKLPPNWCGVTWDTGQIIFSDKQGLQSRDFGYDAFRVFWRMALDTALGSSKAKHYLATHTALLSYWQQYHTLPEGFSPAGRPLGQAPSGFALASAFAQSHVLAPQLDAVIYQKMLLPAYNAQGYWFNAHNDYLQSVIWMSLYTTTLPVIKIDTKQ